MDKHINIDITCPFCGMVFTTSFNDDLAYYKRTCPACHRDFMFNGKADIPIHFASTLQLINERLSGEIQILSGAIHAVYDIIKPGRYYEDDELPHIRAEIYDLLKPFVGGTNDLD